MDELGDRILSLSEGDWEQKQTMEDSEGLDAQHEERRVARKRELLPSTVPAKHPPPTGPLPPTPSGMELEVGESSTQKSMSAKLIKPRRPGHSDAIPLRNVPPPPAITPKGPKRNSAFVRKLALFEQAQLANSGTSSGRLSFKGSTTDAGALTPGRLNTQREQISVPYLQDRISEWEASGRVREDYVPSSKYTRKNPSCSPKSDDDNRKDYFGTSSQSLDSSSSSSFAQQRRRSASQPLPMALRSTASNRDSQQTSKTDLDLSHMRQSNPYSAFKFEESPEESEEMSGMEEDIVFEVEREAFEALGVAETTEETSTRASAYYSNWDGSSEDNEQFEYDELLSAKQLSATPLSPAPPITLTNSASLESAGFLPLQVADLPCPLFSTDLPSSGSPHVAHGNGAEKSTRPELRHEHTFGSSMSGTSPEALKTLSSEDLVRDIRSLSRISGMSQISSGAAFFVSESSSGSMRNSIISFRMDELAPPVPKVAARALENFDGQLQDEGDTRRRKADARFRIPTDLLDKNIPRIGSQQIRESYDSQLDDEEDVKRKKADARFQIPIELFDREQHHKYIIPPSTDQAGPTKLIESAQLSPIGKVEDNAASLQGSGARSLPAQNFKVHPADERYDHVWRVRNNSSTEEPFLVPMYNYPSSGGTFPDRNYLTSPKTNPGFVNHTPRDYEILYLENHRQSQAFHATSESSSELLPKSADGPPMTFLVGPSPSPTPSTSREKYTQSGTFALISNHGKGKKPEVRPEVDFVEDERDVSSRLSQRLRQLSFPFDRKSFIPSIVAKPAPALINEKGYDQEIEEDRRRMTIDTPEGHDESVPAIPAAATVQAPWVNPAIYAQPSLHRTPQTYYGGAVIDRDRYPDQFTRQRNLGRALLFLCIFMPPLWLLMAGGQLDPIVLQLTQGDVWAVAKREKIIAGVLGTAFFVAMITLIVVIFAGLI